MTTRRQAQLATLCCFTAILAAYMIAVTLIDMLRGIDHDVWDTPPPYPTDFPGFTRHR